MFGTVIQIAILHIKIALQERSTVVFMLIMPLLFTALIGWATGGEDGVTTHQLVVANADSGQMGAELVTHLEARPDISIALMNETAALAALESADSEAQAVLVIPPDFSDSLWAGENAALPFYRKQDGSPESQQLIEQAANTATNELLGSLWASTVATQVAANIQLLDGSEAARESYRQAAFTAAESALRAGPPIGLTTEVMTQLPGHRGVTPDGFSQSSPGMIVMFSLFFFLGSGIALIFERTQGTLARLVVMPINQGTIILGKVLGTFVMGLGQMALLIGAGVFLFKVEWGQSPLALLIVVVSYALAATALGILLAATSRSAGQATAILNVGVMVISALGGAWWSLEIVPRWMQTVGHFFPTAWVMDAFHDIITRGLGVQAVLPEVAVLLGFAVLFMVVGIWRFRYE